MIGEALRLVLLVILWTLRGIRAVWKAVHRPFCRHRERIHYIDRVAGGTMTSSLNPLTGEVSVGYTVLESHEECARCGRVMSRMGDGDDV